MHGESNSSARALIRLMASGSVGLARNGYRRVPPLLPSTNQQSAFPISFRELSPVHLTPLCPPLPADVLADGAAGTREFVFGGVQTLVVQGISCSSSTPPSPCQRETGKDARPKAQSKKPTPPMLLGGTMPPQPVSLDVLVRGGSGRLARTPKRVTTTP